MTASATEKRPRTGKARKFFLVRMDFRIRTTPGWRVTNLETLRAGYFTLSPPPDRRGFAEFPEPPSLLIDDSLGRPPVDWEEYEDFMLVSGRMKRILDQIDPGGFAFVKCETQGADGHAGPEYWLCDVVRVLDAVDEEKSRVTIKYHQDNWKIYSLLGGASLIFKEEIVGTAHIFRMRYLEPQIICDQTFKDVCKEAGLKGVAFQDAIKN